MTQHTHGEWVFENIQTTSMKKPEFRVHCAKTGAILTHPNVSEDSARLIAAAPKTKRERDKLFEALEELLIFRKKGQQPPVRCWEKANAAIAAAKVL